jgi:3-oxoadipate enol-lactonase
MPKIEINNCQYHYEKHGTGSEIIVLAHGLLWSGKMFHNQVEYFSKNYTVITYDHRGQGQTQITESGYGMDSLYEDAVALLEKLNLGPVHFGGLSMGGFVAMRLAARRPDLVKSCILMETSALDEPFKSKYTLLNTIVKMLGVSVVTKPVMKIMFGKTFLHDPNRIEERKKWIAELQNNGKSIVKSVEGVIKRKGVEDELKNIKCPTLILVGTEDVATIPEKAEFIHKNIPQSKLVYIQNGGHSSCVEEPVAYNDAIDDFLSGIKL